MAIQIIYFPQNLPPSILYFFFSKGIVRTEKDADFYEPDTEEIEDGLCSVFYEHGNFRGAKLSIKETNQLNFPPNWNDKVSSVKVAKDCTLSIFGDYNIGGLLDTLTEDDVFLDEPNDKVSSVSCSCKGKF